ncbi:hypothetical protein GW814_02580 [Candidatus Falkowbacteria bacterium]|nr:hypothetical protein [Candidatus Falkowbacteria bacterium]
MTAYKFRSDIRGRLPHTLNTEELASIWHFPIEAVVKTPLIQKAPGRKVEPPAGLPVSIDNTAKELADSGPRTSGDIFNLAETGAGSGVKLKAEPPANLPVV